MFAKKSTNLYLAFIILCISSPLLARDDDSDAINVRTFEDMQDSRPEEIQENCELDEMRAYSLIGDATSLSQPNELCPSVSENCCGERDQENIVDLWREDSARIQKYTSYTLKILRYFLGNGENYYSIANSIIEDYKRKDGGNNKFVHMQVNNEEEYGDDESDGYILNSNKYCFDAAEDVVTTNLFHKSTIEPFYHELNQKAEFLHNVRASFYCMLCSTEGQSAISSWRMMSSASNVNYGTDFCQDIVNHTFDITYSLYKNYNQLLSNIIKMLTCVQVPKEERTDNEAAGGATTIDLTQDGDWKSEEPPYELDEFVTEIIDNPLGMSDMGATTACDMSKGTMVWFTGCEYYCQKFNIAKATPFYEYDSDKLTNLFDYLKQYEPILPDASTNVFNDDTISLRKEIEEMYEKLPYNGLFFISKSDTIDISKYDSDFTRMSSFHPMALADGHQLEFHYESVALFKSFFVIAIAFFFWK
jgi:hypothetical protein